MKKHWILGLLLIGSVVISAQKKPEVEWVSVTGGTFLMGTPTTEAERGTDERQHQVTVSDFKIGKYEVTFEQYDAFCRATKRKFPNDHRWGRGKRPVMNVSWHDAKAFAEWMGCRLPTEAEWEYACRAGTTTAFNTGEIITTKQANFNGNFTYGGSERGKYLVKTQPVGSYEPNAWGIYDMHGNVYDWCSDWYGRYPDSPVTNPQGAAEGKYKVFRGGGWNFLPRIARSGYRDFFFPERSDLHIGFRLVSDSN